MLSVGHEYGNHRFKVGLKQIFFCPSSFLFFSVEIRKKVKQKDVIRLVIMLSVL